MAHESSSRSRRTRELFDLAELYKDESLLRRLEKVARELERALKELRVVIEEEKRRGRD